MPNMMESMASGSTAARQMQQNVYGAQYDQQNIAADAQKKQLDLQKEQANIEKTKLGNLVAETGFKASEESKAKLQQLAQSPEGKAALNSKDPSAFFKLALPIQASLGEVKEAAQTLKIIEEGEVKKVLGELKQQEVTRGVLGNAYATVKNASTESSRTGTQAGEEATPFQNLVNNLPPETKELIKKQIPKFFEETDQKLQKSQLEALHMNASNQNNSATNETRLQVAQLQVDQRRETNDLRERLAQQSREGKQDAWLSRQEAHQNDQANKTIARNDQMYKVPLEKAQQAYNSAVTKAKAGMWISDSDANTANESWYAHQEISKQLIQKQLDSVELMSPSTTKDRLYSKFINQLNTIDAASPPSLDKKEIAKKREEQSTPAPGAPPTPKKLSELTPEQRAEVAAAKAKQDKAQAAYGSDYTAKVKAEESASKASDEAERKKQEADRAALIARPKSGTKGVIDTAGTDPNTGLPKDTGLKQKVEAGGYKYEPTKFEYRVLPDGSVQRKAK